MWRVRIHQIRLRDLAARCARAVHLSLAPSRAWGMPGARCTRSPLCNVESTGVEATDPPESPGIPARNGFNSLCRALPGDRALLPPSSRGYLARPRPVGPTCLPQNLTPASGRQDHTILPSAATSLVSGLFDRSQAFRLALRSHRAQNAAASTASHPAFVTIMIRPSVWDGMAKVLEVIWGVRKQEYFCIQDWTGGIRLIRFNKFAVARNSVGRGKAS